jgi:nitrite reductase/ring-hydroxylating ferredoxin subunit
MTKSCCAFPSLTGLPGPMRPRYFHAVTSVQGETLIIGPTASQISKACLWEMGMAEQRVLSVKDLPKGAKKTVKLAASGLASPGDEVEILLVNHEGSVLALQAKCPHAGAPLEKGAICNGHLVCPWHMGTFALPGGQLIEPPPLEGLKTYRVRIGGDDIFVDSEAQPQASPGRDCGQNAPCQGRHSPAGRHQGRLRYCICY